MGLLMIAASLVAISVVIVLLFLYEKESREEQIRTQGVQLVRLLSGMSEQLLEQKDKGVNVLKILLQSQNSPDFAYIVVTDLKGDVLNEFVRPGTIVPRTSYPEHPSSWLGEKRLVVSGSGRQVLEFHAPLLLDGNLKGFVRLGYYEIGYQILTRRLPFFATLALPVFLLTPLFYFLVRREIKPLRVVNREMEQFLEQGNLKPPKLAVSGELSDFMASFSRFMEYTQKRIKELEAEHTGLLTSTKVLSFRRARVEAVLHAMPDALVILDESGVASFVNSKLLPLLGVKRSDVIGHPPRAWCSSTKVVNLLARYESAGQCAIAMDSVEFSPPHAEEKTVSVSAFPLFASEKQSTCIGTLVMFRDVTEENAAKQAHVEFIAQVAHELKTPLNTLLMYSDALLDDEEISKEFRIEGLNVIHDESERLATLINNLLSLSKFELGGLEMKRQRVRLPELLTDAFENVSQGGRGQDLSFIIDVPQEISPLFVDKELLRIAINNLLTNAIKYNRPGGRVELVAEEGDEEIRIQIKDTGIGISEEEREKIFKKFYRAENEQVRARSGHGLGLPLVQQIIYLHHGELEVTSQQGAGSEFTIVLRKDTGILRQAV